MTVTPFKWFPVIALLAASSAPVAVAQPAPRLGEQQHAQAIASFRQARFSEAYGRTVALADAGHAPSAELALWMYQNGPALFGKDWDTTPEQLAAWAVLARRPVPKMVGSSYPALPVADRRR
ncbi:MAG: hypothetical protein Q8K45_22230 [Rubrivivax sp.]|nr:hypothetical protein [Rubrivivax sp.]